MNELSQHYSNCEPIAVIGMVCRFPSAPDCDTFWQNLIDGKECSRPLTRQELLDAGVDEETINSPEFVNVSAPLDDADLFDAAIFGYSRQEAETLDPQQRLFLQSVWHVLEHAGYAPKHVPHKTGVFGSARMSTYAGRERIQTSEIARPRGMQALLGNDKDYLATRAAYKLNLTGPALTVQTACSSSLVAVHLACESLRSGECSMAVAGGVGISFPQHTGYRHQPGMIFSSDGRCRPFDAKADGTFGGNGVGVVALRRLEDALADGDPIVAVIRGSAINNDGDQKVGFTAPSTSGQTQVILEAMTIADVSSSDIGMIEAHGTATSLGDPIEFAALRSAYEDRPSSIGRCAIGSVKASIGHLDTAAGIASLIKAVLAVQRDTIPPAVNFTCPNPLLEFEKSCFYAPRRAEQWSQSVRTAGVSSFGIGGTNCHVIVQSLPTSLSLRKNSHGNTPLTGSLLLSAGSEASLRRIAGEYAKAWTTSNPQDLAHTALAGRRLDLPYRLCTALSEEAPASLRAFADGSTDPLLHYGTPASSGKMAWLFTGVGSQWAGMGQELHDKSSAFADAIERCNNACDGRLLAPLTEIMFGGHTDLLDRIDHALPVIVSYEIAMAAHWRSLGLRPDVVIGHSLGEYAAAAVAGFYTEEQMISLAIEGSRLLYGCEDGAMLAAVGDESTLSGLAKKHGVEVAVLNGPRHLVFSGAKDNIASFGKVLREARIRTRALPVSCAAHCSLVEPILETYRAYTGDVRATEGHTRMISSFHGEAVNMETLNGTDFWCNHLRRPVRYREAIQRVLAEDVGICLELGPDANLTDIGERDGKASVHWIPVARRSQPESTTLHQAATRMFAAGIDLPWKQLLNIPGRRVHAPLYSFDEQRFWLDPDTLALTKPLPPTLDSGILEGRRVAASASSGLDLGHLHEFAETTRTLHNIYVDKLVQACVGDRIDQGVDPLDILRSGRILPRYRQLLIRLLNACVMDGYYEQTDGQYRRVRSIPHDQLSALIERLRNNSEGLDVIPEIVAEAGEKLYEILTGRVEPLTILFPAARSEGVEVIYRDFSTGRYFNQIAAGVLKGLIEAAPSTSRRILEVGGGTGATTACLLPALVPLPGVEYHFTDISPIFTRRAEEKFRDYPFVQYREFDLQKDLLAQGFLKGSYDVIVAANVIHATQHIGRTLESLHSLLKPGGRLLMREITQPVRLFDFVFGSLIAPLHDDEARHGELFLSVDLWKQHCKDAGFEAVHWLPNDESETASLGEHILVAAVPHPSVAVASSASLLVDVGSVLGRYIDGCETYLADWSDCHGKAVLLTERVRHACSEMMSRHRTDPLLTCPISVDKIPQTLSDVRLRWIAGGFGAARVDIAYRDKDRRWRVFARGGSIETASANSLPMPQAAPETHYAWSWKPTVIDARNDGSPYAIEGPPEVTNRLAKAGLQLAPDAPTRIIILPDTDPIALAQRVFNALADQRRCPLVFITKCAWSISHNDVVSPAHRGVWGLLRVAASEDANRSISVLDLGIAPDWDFVPRCLDAISSNLNWAAIRNGVIYTQQLILTQLEVAPPPPGILGNRGWHVVTGGLGGLGRVSINWLAQQGARKIAILAHRSHSDQEVFFHQLSQSFGCTAKWFECDVSDLTKMGECLEALHRDGGVAGAIHAAGILDDAPHNIFTADRLKPVFSVKAGAAEFMQDWLREHGARYLLLYSSAAAALGARGQSAHAFTCGYLDGLASASTGTSQRSDLTTISIAWGAWGEVGRASDPTLRTKLAEAGMSTLSTAEGLWHLEQAVMLGSPYRLAMRLQESAEAHLELLSSGIPRSTAARTISGSVAVALAEPQAISAVAASSYSDVVKWMTARVAEQLRLDDVSTLTPENDLLQIGLDSLLFLELSSEIRQHFGVLIDTESAYHDLTISAIARLITERISSEPQTPDTPQPVHDEDHRFDPFPLTPIQHAYWLGRTELLEYGGVACHVIFEWDKRSDEFDLSRFEQAWNALILRHDMLRMVIDTDGRQRVLEHVPEYRFVRTDLRSYSTDERSRALEKTRNDLSYKVLRTDQWPLFEILISQLDDTHYRLHMNLDLLQFDTQSFKIMMDDLQTVYSGNALKPLTFTFRDYVQMQLAERESTQWLESWIFWHDLLPGLPPAPFLPLANNQIKRVPRFSTYQERIDATSWAKLKEEWKQWGVTPSAALLCLFALVLERFSRHPQFTLNLTFFNRKQYHPDVQQIIGDFTSVLLVDFDVVRDRSIKELIENTQERLWERLARSEINGVELVREMGRGDALNSQPAMPIVFTSMLGVTLDGKDISQALSSFLGDPVYLFTQTPQVWLDHQVMEVENELVYNWFEMEGVLQHGLAAKMFAEYTRLLQSFAADPARMREIGSWPLREDLAESLDQASLTVVNGQQVNLLRLERILRAHPMIRKVQVELLKDEIRESLAVYAVARDVESPFVPTYLIDIAILPSLSQEDLSEVESIWRRLEEGALFGICQTLMRHGLFIVQGSTLAFDEICSTLKTLPRFRRLIRQWLAMLAEKGWLRWNGTLYECVRSLHALSAPESLDLKASWSQHLLQYLETSNSRHDAMLRGDHSPLQILFDEDEHVARTLYSDNPVMRFLNSSAAKVAEQVTRGSGRLSVLEVGGGTGATTIHMLSTLAPRLLSYHFTDVSPLFLDDAKKQFKEYPVLNYGLFDINQPLDFSVHPDEGYDLIVAANVLHDATHVVRSLRRLGRLLAPKGHLLIIEATERNSVFQLATVGFIEGLSGFQDFRTLDNKAMLDLPMWRTALEKAGFSLDFTWPSDAVSSIKQHLLVARPLFNARLDFDAIQEYLRRETSIPAVELSFQRVETLPHPSRRISPERRTFLPSSPASPPLPDSLSFILDATRSVWEALLPGRQVRVDTDFFLSGGDSLIATRMVAALTRQGFVDASLQKLYANPVLEDFCKTLTMTGGRRGDNPVLLANGTEAEPVYLFHTSDGEVSVYLNLAKALDRPVYALQAPQTFNSKTLQDLAADYVGALRQHHDQSVPYILAGWSYGAFLAVEAARQLLDSGAIVKLILLDPVCRADFEYEDRVGLLKLLEDGPGGLSLPENFEQLSLPDQLEILRSQTIDSGLLPSSTDIEQIGKWVDRTDYLFSLLKTQSSPPRLQVPSLWITAARRPARWRPAEFEWSRWDEHAHYISIQADHWEMVMTDTYATQTANAINNWLKRDARNE